MITQAQAQKLLGTYSQKVADLLGATVPGNLVVRVVSPAEMLQVAGSAAASATVGTTIYISSDQAQGNLAGMIVYETSHAIHQASGGGYSDVSSQTAGEAMAQAVRIELGLASPDSADNLTQKFLGLSPQEFQAASQQLSSGTYTNIRGAAEGMQQPATSPGSAQLGNVEGQMGTGTAFTAGATAPATGGIWVDPKTGAIVPEGTPGAISLAQYATQQQSQSNKAGKTNFQAAANMTLQSWGLPITPSLQALIDQGTKAGWNMTTFQYYLEQSPEFHQAFPGIFDSNGTLKMSPTAYLSTVKSYQSYAAQAGVDLNPQQLNYLFRNDVSPAEFAQRAQAVTTLRTNKQYFDAFNQQLKQEGMAPLSRGDQFKFVMGEGNQAWYDLWQQASTRYSAEQAGLKFGQAAKSYTNLGQGLVEKVAGLGLSQPQMQQSFAQLAKDLQTTYPMSQIQKFNITKQDLVELEFGGPRQAAVAKKVSQVMANEKAFLTNRVSSLGQEAALQTGRSQQNFAQGP